MKLKQITILTGLALLASSQAYSHGYVGSPSSRGLFCANGDNKNCGSVQYEPQSIEASDGGFESGRMDGRIGNAGLSKWENLNDQSASRWTKTYIRSGQPLDITWEFTANHSSASFGFYITKQSWDVNTKPKFSDFEKLNCYNPQPYWQAPDRPPRSGLTYTCTIPGGRTGPALIASVWDVADTGASFYNLVDVYFTDDPNLVGKVRPTTEDSNGGNPDSDAIPAWDANAVYAESGQEVHYEGKVYRNKWWTKGNAPGSNNVWEYVKEYEGDTGGLGDPTTPTDRHPEFMTSFSINQAEIKAGDEISLQLSDSATSQLKEFELLTVPDNFSYGNLLKTLAEKVNEISNQELNDAIIAGSKDASGVVNPSTSELNIYQTADKRYNAVSFVYDAAVEPTPTPTDKTVKVTLTSNTPFYQLDGNGLVPRAWYHSLSEEINLGQDPIVVAPYGNPNAKVSCPLPSAAKSEVTYFISGDTNSITCKIKKSNPNKFWVW